MRASSTIARGELLTTPRLQYTPSGAQNCVRASIDVVVDTSGRTVPSTARTIRANDQALVEAVIASLDGYRFTPALRDGVKVPQIVRLEHAGTVRVVIASPGGSFSRAQRTPRNPPC